MRLVRSISDSPVLNGLLEEHLLTERPLGDVLLFYINRPSVIVGRNQRIEAEVDTDYCLRHGIEIVRRLSGGGTVYHDYGNINYAFIVDKDERPVLDRDFATPIIDALRPLASRPSRENARSCLSAATKSRGPPRMSHVRGYFSTARCCTERTSARWTERFAETSRSAVGKSRRFRVRS